MNSHVVTLDSTGKPIRQENHITPKSHKVQQCASHQISLQRAKPGSSGSQGKRAIDLFTQTAAPKAAVVPGFCPRINAASVKSIIELFLKQKLFLNTLLRPCRLLSGQTSKQPSAPWIHLSPVLFVQNVAPLGPINLKTSVSAARQARLKAISYFLHISPAPFSPCSHKSRFAPSEKSQSLCT